MKKFRITIVVEADDDMNKSDFIIMDDDVIDGFQLSRWNGNSDVTTDFKLKSAYIEKTEETSDKTETIKRIKSIISEWGSTTSAELELESSPCVSSIGNNKMNVSALVEEFGADKVKVVVYQDQNELDEYYVSYEDLDDDTLEEISNIMDDYDAEQYKARKRWED